MSDLSPRQLAQACAEQMYERDAATRALGMTLEHIEPGCVVMTMKILPNMINGHGSCHGGLIYSLADSCFAFACNSRNQKTVASGCSIDYIAPAFAGDSLTAVAKERSLAGRTGLYDVAVSNQDDQPIAYFRGRSYRIKGSVLSTQEEQS